MGDLRRSERQRDNYAHIVTLFSSVCEVPAGTRCLQDGTPEQDSDSYPATADKAGYPGETQRMEDSSPIHVRLLEQSLRRPFFFAIAGFAG